MVVYICHMPPPSRSDLHSRLSPNTHHFSPLTKRTRSKSLAPNPLPVPKMKPVHLLLGTFALTASTVTSQLVDPYPVSDCSRIIAGTGLQCTNQAGCCLGGAECCARGCCPLTAICINKGSANEGCCPLGDKSMCGYASPTPTVSLPRALSQSIRSDSVAHLKMASVLGPGNR
jgi:hypothetical protein